MNHSQNDINADDVCSDDCAGQGAGGDGIDIRNGARHVGSGLAGATVTAHNVATSASDRDNGRQWPIQYSGVAPGIY